MPKSTTPSSVLASIAAEIKAAQDACTPLAPVTDRFPGFGVAEAYTVARTIHELRLREGAVPVGRKIGFTNPNIWPVYGVHQPIWGYVYDRTVQRAAAQPIRCRIGGFAEPKIEPELVLHFHSAPPATDDAAEILACVDWIAHGFEIVQSHFPEWKFQAADTVADSALHATLLVGAPLDADHLGTDGASRLADFEVSLFCDGELRERGQGSNVLGSPLNAVAHLLSVLGDQPDATPVQAGELVTTGTLTAALPVRAGQTWHTELGGLPLPGLSVSFEV